MAGKFWGVGVGILAIIGVTITGATLMDNRVGRVEDRVHSEFTELRREIGNLRLTVELIRLGRVEVSPTGSITSEDEARLRRIVEEYDLEPSDWREFIWLPEGDESYWEELEVTEPNGD
ncbi:hypothetical protein [Glycocaulis sp.]|uniref:hypothetical protein n=1 Tax=Glycocaulis sp. TaxID=1969725 RepID=UPI0025B84CCF|nr:hypothetical protein [Glycocaulis sp.]MCH8522346.1 hypothetical protein [Glycocaulis sp.]